MGQWIKGSSQTLIKDGRIDRETLRNHRLGEDDLLEELRLSGVEEPGKAKLSHLR